MSKERISSATLIATLVIAVAIVTGITPVSAHDNFQHLWNDHIKPKLADPGTINKATNPVNWTKLKGVPSGLADGKDYGIENAGFGLKSLGNDESFLGKWFAVDTQQVQRRVKNACSGDTAIASIAENGEVTCNKDNATHAYALAVTDTGIICNDFCTEGSLALPAGSYFVTAKIEIYQHDIDEDQLFAFCTLHAGTGSDQLWMNHLDSISDEVVLQTVGTLASAGNTSLNCRDQDVGDSQGGYLKITALRLSGIN